jgi:GT2 family glycosyltransferase
MVNSVHAEPTQDKPLYAVTVTYNGGTVLKGFLACCFAQTGVNFQLIIIDNASTDNTREILSETRNTHVTVILNDENVGVAAANNQGIEMARRAGADHILLINNDTEFGPTLFVDLIASLSKSGAAAITPLIPFFDKPDKIWYGGGRFLNWRGGISFHNHFMKDVAVMPAAVFKTDYAPTCCMVFKCSVFDQIGYMDEQYFVYWDDVDFCWRMREAGLAIICDPRLTLMHKVSVSTGGGESDFSIRYIYRNHMLFLRKYRSRIFRFYVLMILAIKAFLRLALGKTDHRRLRLQIAALKEGLNMDIQNEGASRFSRVNRNIE